MDKKLSLEFRITDSAFKYLIAFVHKGGPLGPIHFWELSRRNSGTKLAPCSECIHSKRPYSSNKNKKKVSFQNGGKKKRIFVSRKSHVTKIWKKKTHCPKEFFRNLLKVEEHKYIYIFEIEFEIFRLKMAAKTIFFTKRCVTDS